jgi:tetratricopeptide (TPR) repeat protein
LQAGTPAVRGKEPAPMNHESQWKKTTVRAIALHREGRYAESATIAKEALAAAEKCFGPQHPHVAVCLNNLAECYRELGRCQEAEPLYERALAIREKVYGQDSIPVAHSLSNLAALFYCQKRYAEAETYTLRALRVQEAGLGPEHPDVAHSLTNLTGILLKQERSHEAVLSRRFHKFPHVFPREFACRDGRLPVSATRLAQGGV